jgi:hypothetical protein
VIKKGRLSTYLKGFPIIHDANMLYYLHTDTSKPDIAYLWMYDMQDDRTIDTRAVPYPASYSKVKIDVLDKHIILLLKGKDPEFRRQSVYIFSKQNTRTMIVKDVRDFDVYMDRLFIHQEGVLKIYSY